VETRRREQGADLNPVSVGIVTATFRPQLPLFRFQRTIMCGEREGIFILNAAREYVDPIAPHEKCRLNGSVVHTGRITYEDDANVDLHRNHNALSQLLLYTALIWSVENADVADLKTHLKQVAQQSFPIALAREDQYVSHIASHSNYRSRLLIVQAYHQLC